jgi:hypothetical protein
MLKRVVLFAVLALLLSPASALADELDLVWVGGTWSWGGSPNPLTVSVTTVDPATFPATPWMVITFIPTAGSPIGGFMPTGSTLSFTTGGFLGGSGTTGDQWVWSATGSSLTLSSAFCGGVCLAGSFTTPITGQTDGFGSSIVGGFVGTFLSQALIDALGIPTTPNTPWTGAIHVDLNGNISTQDGGKGTQGSGDLNLTPVPEPGTLALFGTGLLSLAGAIRRKLAA